MPRKKVRPILAPLDIAQRYSVQEACEYLRTSRASLYKKITAGELRTLKDGARVYLPGTEIARASALPA
jgi:excisionase family DNA binding protein